MPTFVISIENFMVQNIVEFEELHKKWSKSLLEYDTAKQKLDLFLNSKDTIEPIKLLRAQILFSKSRVIELNRFETAFDKLQDSLWLRDFKLLQDVVKFMQGLNLNIESCNNVWAINQSYIPGIREYIKTTRQEYQKEREKLKKDKKDALLLEYETRYEKLVKLLSNEDLALVNAICVSSGSDQETNLRSLIFILDSYKMTMPIIKLGITREVEKTKDVTTLFRGNSMATKLMSAFTKLTGKSYIELILKSNLNYLNDLIEKGDSFEIDPQKNSGNDITENIERLNSVSQLFFDSIVSNIDACPIPFKVIAHHLKEEVTRSHPQAKYISVAGFIFLRFICPVILSPDSTEPPLIQSLSSKLRRTLILISKCLQNLANGVDFSSKEAFMQPMNNFVHSNTEKLHLFLDEISNIPELENYEPLCPIEDAKKELVNLHIKIIQNLPKIGTTLIQYKQEYTIQDLSFVLANIGEEELNMNLSKKKPK